MGSDAGEDEVSRLVSQKVAIDPKILIRCTRSNQQITLGTLINRHSQKCSKETQDDILRNNGYESCPWVDSAGRDKQLFRKLEQSPRASVAGPSSCSSPSRLASAGTWTDSSPSTASIDIPRQQSQRSTGFVAGRGGPQRSQTPARQSQNPGMMMAPVSRPATAMFHRPKYSSPSTCRQPSNRVDPLIGQALQEMFPYQPGSHRLSQPQQQPVHGQRSPSGAYWYHAGAEHWYTMQAPASATAPVPVGQGSYGGQYPPNTYNNANNPGYPYTNNPYGASSAGQNPYNGGYGGYPYQ